MDTEIIVIVLDHNEICIPEQVVFRTVFRLKNPLTLTDDLAQADRQFLGFLSANSLASSETLLANMDAGEQEYTCPSYLIPLTYPIYLLLEKYRDEHPELTGYVVAKTFSQKDQERFLTNLSNKAREMAEQKAQQRGLILGNVLETEKVESKPNNWMMYPPLSVRYNHFQQVLTGQYRLVFSVQTPPS